MAGAVLDGEGLDRGTKCVHARAFDAVNETNAYVRFDLVHKLGGPVLHREQKIKWVNWDVGDRPRALGRGWFDRRGGHGSGNGPTEDNPPCGGDVSSLLKCFSNRLASEPVSRVRASWGLPRRDRGSKGEPQSSVETTHFAVALYSLERRK